MMQEPKVGRTMLGLVGASGSGGSSVGQSNEWALTFRLAAWRYTGAEVETGEQYCSLPVAYSDLSDWMARVKPYAVVEIEIEDDSSERVVKVSRILRTDATDPELRRIAAELQTPIVIPHPVFGKMEYQRAFGWYVGRAEWNGKNIDVSLSCSNADDPIGVLDAASRLFREQEEWVRRVNDYAVEQLLPLKNDSWLDEGEAELTKEQFLAKMKLESISVEEAGSFTFWHDDGDLFFGHSIQISGDFENGLTDADTPG